jgi:hypothetical protein
LQKILAGSGRNEDSIKSRGLIRLKIELKRPVRRDNDGVDRRDRGARRSYSPHLPTIVEPGYNGRAGPAGGKQESNGNALIGQQPDRLHDAAINIDPGFLSLPMIDHYRNRLIRIGNR